MAVTFTLSKMEKIFAAARENDVIALFLLTTDLDVDKKKSLIDATDSEGKSAVTIAIENNCVEAVQWFVENGCRLSVHTQRSDRISVAGECIDQEQEQVDSSSEIFYPPLLAAVTAANLEIADVLLQACPSIVDDGYFGTTPLITACIQGCLPMVDLLLQYGAAVDGTVRKDMKKHSETQGGKTEASATAKEMSCETKFEETAKLWKYRPLYHAVAQGHENIVERLARQGASYKLVSPVPCVKHNAGSNAVPVAEDSRAHSGSLSDHWVTVLVPVQVPYVDLDDTEMTEDENGCLLELAVLNCPGSLEFLLDFYHQDISMEDIFATLIFAVSVKSRLSVEIIFEKCFRSQLHRFQQKAMPVAVTEQHVDNSPGEKLGEGQVNDGDSDAAKVDERGSLINKLCCLLRWSIRDSRGDDTLPLLLLDCYGDLLAGDSGGETLSAVLFIAVFKNLPQVVKKVLEIVKCHYTMDMILQNPENLMRLKGIRVWILSRGAMAMMQTLWDAGVLAHIPNSEDMIFEALACGRYGTSVHQVLKWLIDNMGLDPRAPDVYGEQPIHVAVRQNIPDAVDALCQLGVDADAPNPVRGNFTPLQLHLLFCHLQLTMDPNPQLMQTLIAHGADLAARCGRGSYHNSAMSKLFWLVEVSREFPPRRTSSLGHYSQLLLHPNSIPTNSDFEVPFIGRLRRSSSDGSGPYLRHQGSGNSNSEAEDAATELATSSDEDEEIVLVVGSQVGVAVSSSIRDTRDAAPVKSDSGTLLPDGACPDDNLTTVNKTFSKDICISCKNSCPAEDSVASFKNKRTNDTADDSIPPESIGVLCNDTVNASSMVCQDLNPLSHRVIHQEIQSGVTEPDSDKSTMLQATIADPQPTSSSSSIDSESAVGGTTRSVADDPLSPAAGNIAFVSQRHCPLLRGAIEYDLKVPFYLLPGQPQRAFVESLVHKFGLELQRMGAASLMYRRNWRRIEFSLSAAGLDCTHVPGLKALCWLRVRQCLGSVSFQEKVNQLPLPSALKQYLIVL